MEYIPEFKKNINNPYNIKGFYKLFNNQNIKPTIKDEDIKSIQSSILNEQNSNRKSIEDVIKDYGVNYSTVDFNDKFKNLNSTQKLVSHGDDDYKMNYKADYLDQNTSIKEVENFDFIEEIKEYESDEEVSIEKEMEAIEKERIKSRIRTVLREIKLSDTNYEVEVYYNIIKKPGIKLSQLTHVLNILETDLSGFEGQSFIKDGIVAITGMVESYVDGTVNIMGRYPDLTGLSNSMEVSLRKRKIETAKIHRNFREKVGWGPWSQVGIEFVLNTGITIQRNSRGTDSETQNAVRLRRNIDG